MQMQMRLQEKVLGTVMLYTSNPPVVIAKAILPANICGVIQLQLVDRLALLENQEAIAKINEYLLANGTCPDAMLNPVSMKRGEAPEGEQIAALSLLIDDGTNHHMVLEG